MSGARYLTTMDPSIFYEAVTPSDTVNFIGPADAAKGPGGDVLSVGVWVGVAGVVVAVRDDDTTITFTSAIAGVVLPIKCKRINSASTTATDMVALF